VNAGFWAVNGWVGEMGRWGDGEMEGLRDGEIERWRDRENSE